MAFNPNSQRDIARLRMSMEQSRKSLECYRNKRIELVRDYVGMHYSDDEGGGKRTPVPLLALFINIVLRQSVARLPKVTISSPYSELASFAWDFEIAMNALLAQIQFGRAMRVAALDAMFCQGITKVAMAEKGQAELAGKVYTGLHPFCDTVDLDDWVIDMEPGRRWDQASYMGDRHSVVYEQLMESNLYSKQAKDGLTATEPSTTNEDGSEKIDVVGNEPNRGAEPFQDHIDLWDIWIPSQQLMVTLPAEPGKDKPLRVIDWNGPARGPYHQLGFYDVPGRLMKLSPVMLLSDLHNLSNDVYSKASDQAIGQKTILGAMAEAENDAKNIIEAEDGDVVKLNHPDKVKEFAFNGVDQFTLAFALEAMQRFSYFAGNLDALGGLGRQADTARQEDLITSSAGTQIQFIQGVCADFARENCEDLGELLWRDPMITLPLYRVPEKFADLGIRMPFKWTPEDRIGDFAHYNLKIVPYSMQEKTPQQRLQNILVFLSQAFAPNAPFAIQQGVGVNFEGLSRAWAHLSDMDEIEQILTFSGPPAADRKSPVGEMPMKPGMTTRRYERINTPGATNAGKTESMMQMLMGSRLQGSQRASMARPAA